MRSRVWRWVATVNGVSNRAVRLGQRSSRVPRRLTIGALTFRVVSSSGPQNSARAPVVLIHGIGMSHLYFERLHARLAAVGPVHSIDLPGFAGVPRPSGDIDILTMGRALADIVAMISDRPVVLFGHSMGAQWATEAAVHRPEVVVKLVIMGPVADVRRRTLPNQMAALALDTLCEPPLANAIVLIDYARCGLRWYLTQVRHMISYPIEDRVGLLTMPVLVIRGGKDPIASSEWCRMLRNRSPDARLVHLPGRHHLAQFGAAPAVAAAIAAFISTA